MWSMAGASTGCRPNPAFWTDVFDHGDGVGRRGRDPAMADKPGDVADGEKAPASTVGEVHSSGKSRRRVRYPRLKPWSFLAGIL